MQLSDLVGDFDVRPMVTFTPATVQPNTQVLLPNPMRWGIIFSGNTSQVITLGDNSLFVTNHGFVLATQSPLWAINFRDLGAVVCGPWFANSAAAGGFLSIIEIWYRPLTDDGDYARTLEEWSKFTEGMRR